MKKLLGAATILILMGSLYGQSVVELSRKEKERREALRSHRAKVVTNADLAAVRKTEAVIVSNPDSAADTGEAAAEGPQIIPSVAPPAGEDSQPVVMVPTVARNGPALFTNDTAGDALASGKSLEDRLKAATELVDLLTTKMNALWQEFYNLNTMTTQDRIQQQIDETYQKLLKAQADEAKLKSQLEASQAASPVKR
jgi:hypothetical protein